MINKIKKNHLCLGCGLCSSVLGEANCKMELTSEGFYSPVIAEGVDDSIVEKICPGINVHGNNKKALWGKYIKVEEGWSCDNDLRFHSSSGGVVSALAVSLLKENLVDAVLHVGVSNNDCLSNELMVSRCREDVYRNAQSRYAPALTLHNVKQLLDSGEEVYAYIGKACDIAGLKNFIEVFPQYQNRIKYFISIICAGMPSFEGTKKCYSLSGNNNVPIKLKYRGDGWPGKFEVEWKDGQKFSLTYQESWGEILGHYLNFRCKVCADGIGSLADISVGDSWRTKDGYPDFEEREGRSLVFVRTQLGEEVVRAAKNNKSIDTCPIEASDIEFMQPGQYNRRKYAGWRIIPVQILTCGFLSFHNLGIIYQALTANFIEGLRNTKGTFKRFIALRKSN